MINWIKSHPRPTIAVAGCFLLWCGIAALASLPITLMASGVLMMVGAVMSMMP